MIDEARLRQVLKAYEAFIPARERPSNGVMPVAWRATTAGWSLEPWGGGWKFEGATMDVCVEAFAAKIREVSASAVVEQRSAYDAALARARAVEAALS